MSVGLTMEDVNKPVPTQMDHLSAHVIRVIAYHLMAQTVLVSIPMVFGDTMFKLYMTDIIIIIIKSRRVLNSQTKLWRRVTYFCKK